MRAVLFALALACVATLAPAQDRSPEEVIGRQIEAFRLDDFETAFTFAHPSIRDIFRTPENFGRMVRQGYPMVWRPAEVDYLDQRSDGGRLMQDVRIVDAAGRVFVLRYSMIETPEGWKIGGVQILEQAGVSA